MEIEKCSLCPRHCSASRTADSGEGFCRMGSDAVVARAALHFWEEPCISGKNGSGAIFFSGCSLHCVFCQNNRISRENFGRRVSADELSDLFRRLVDQGAENINLVTATHFVPVVLQALQCYRPPVPVIFNCGGYETVETLRALEGWVDIYLPDLKYGLSEPAQRYSSAPDYPGIAQAALLEMHRQQPECRYDERGMLQKGMIVRHLILPENTCSSIAVLEWLAQNMPQVPVSLMAQYLPCGRASDFPEINRRITLREYNKVLDRLFALNLDGFVQERSSAKKAFIPPFNLEGLENKSGTSSADALQ